MAYNLDKVCYDACLYE